MQVNKKKSIRLKNRTKYFDAERSKTYVQFSSPETYQSRRIKIEGYESRLYWQFRYCDEHNGQTYFYTLTYNDLHLPEYLGQVCFDYEDLRDLLTGGFRKQLLRKYGTTFKYFIGAELGDGKGERGMHNNPHYHILFFLEDAKNSRFPYRKILPEQFRHLVRTYWQGFDEDTDGARDYRLAKYGIAREGENLGLVTDYRACMYCAKYVCKDVKLKMHEKEIEKKLRFKYKQEAKTDEDIYKSFFYEYLYPTYNIPLNAKHTEWVYDRKAFIAHLLGEAYQLSLYPDFLLEDGDDDDIDYFTTVNDIVVCKNLWKEFSDFKRVDIEARIKQDINDYRNRYCNKCRISHGVGDYALDFMDLENPTVQVPSKKGFKNRPLNMYYYRKLFTDVYIDKTGSPIRVLNELGQEYKLRRLDEQIKKKVDAAQGDLNIILHHPELYEKMKNSDINTQVFFSYDDFLAEYNYLLLDNNIKNILQRYGEYKLVYEDRYFKVRDDRVGEYGAFPDISVADDFRRFLTPSYFTCRRSDVRLNSFLERCPEDWICYYAHPYFLRFTRIFAVLDMCSDYFFIQDDDRKQAEAEEAAEVKRFHDRAKVKEFYSAFGL